MSGATECNQHPIAPNQHRTVRGLAMAESKSINEQATRDRIASISRQMRYRCHRPANDSYRYYGAKGISVCPEWRQPIVGFKAFYEWSMANGYKPGLTIDRINPAGNYEPSNCRWIPRTENCRKTSPLSQDAVLEILRLVRSGETQAKVAALFNVSHTCVYQIVTGIRWSWLTGVTFPPERP